MSKDYYSTLGIDRIQVRSKLRKLIKNWPSNIIQIEIKTTKRQKKNLKKLMKPIKY